MARLAVDRARAGLPDNALVRLRQRAGELLKTEIDYAATVIRAFVHDLDHPDGAPGIGRLGQRAVSARAAFEATAGATRHRRAGSLRRWMRPYRAALNAVTTSRAPPWRRILPAHPPPNLNREFVSRRR